MSSETIIFFKNSFWFSYFIFKILKFVFVIISRIFKSECSDDTQILGTTGYAAPEQYGIFQTDQRADIYSMGILLNIMLTGKHPSRELASGRLGRIVQKCTMVNPQKRYKNVRALMEAL